MTIPKKTCQNTIPACTISSVIPIGNDLQLPGLSPSAFRPFITQTSLTSSQNQTIVTATPVSKQNTRLTLPETTISSTLQPSSSPNFPAFLEASINNDDNSDGRTTASAPPCTPAPEPYQQPQSPFRNRQIKKIDLLAMSRSRQSDRAENARRDGRLAPSPRKKDEVLRNSGFTFPVGRGLRSHSSLRLSLHNGSLTTGDTELSPERLANGTSSAASPNVDVVSVDDQPDPSKCTFSIQFHDFASAEQMMKCSLCGFVTNNQKFYRRHRRLHSRQYQPDIIHCSLCDYSTSQIRKMREHTITSHHLPYPHSFTSSNQSFTIPSTMTQSAHHPPVHGQMYIGTGSIFHPVTIRPVNMPVETATSTTTSRASNLDLPTYIPTPQDHHIRVNTQAGLQHPPRGSAMLGNYAPANEQQVASYMQSVISNLMSPSYTNPNSSSKSSNSYFHSTRNSSQDSHTVLPSNNTVPITEETYNFRQFWNSNNSSLSSNQNLSETSFKKVKMESRTTPASIAARNIYGTPSRTQKDKPTQSPRRQSDTLDSESGMDMSSDDHTSSPHPDIVNSREDTRVSTETNQTDNSTQVDGPTFGTQGSMPFIKIEFPPHRDSCNHLGHSDRGVQCEIISTSGLSYRQGHMQSETVSSAGGSTCVETRCYYCGVTFDDEVLHSLHIGCHSHTDPFMCNVCGKQCHNKYGFYSHIMRGHHARSNT
uniref:C2H2-type domain-containing protein n=3 Tax=Arion vulgaris TaxID=1028688 RepID=A0A0B7ACL4_9EUPU